MKIAVTGKGGVGKTFIAGSLACLYAHKGLKTIVIDADTSPNLALTLGLSESESESIVPIADNTYIIDKKTKTDFPGVFRLTFPVDDIIETQSVPIPCGARLLVMGTVKTMGSGCTCPAHSLVRSLISHLVTDADEVVILDMEAGIEHLGRGTAEYVDIMLIISDAHQASLVTAERIARIAKDGGIQKIALVANRVASTDHEKKIRSFAGELNIDVAGVIPFDMAVMQAGIDGVSPLMSNGGGKQAISDLIAWLSKGEHR